MASSWSHLLQKKKKNRPQLYLRTSWSCWATTNRRFSEPLRLPINPGNRPGAACSILWCAIRRENLFGKCCAIRAVHKSWPIVTSGLATEPQRPAFNYRPASARRATCVLIDQAAAQRCSNPKSEYESDSDSESPVQVHVPVPVPVQMSKW